MDKEWSDSKKWWMDLAKSAVSFTFAAFVSLFLIGRLQEARVLEKARGDAFYSARLEALEEFREASVGYDLAAHTAYTELYQWDRSPKSEAMLAYEQDAYPRWFISLETIQFLYPELTDKTESVRRLGQTRHKIYDHMIDAVLDNRSTAQELQPEQERECFDALGQGSKHARSQLIASIQHSLFSQEFHQGSKPLKNAELIENCLSAYDPQQ